METTDYLITAAIILLAAGQLVAIVLLIVVLITARKLLKHADNIASKGSWVFSELSSRMRKGSPFLGAAYWLLRHNKKGRS